MQLKKIKGMQRQIRELIKENDKQKAVNDNINEDICFKTDKELNLTFVNDALIKKLEFKRENLIGKSIFGTLLDDNKAIISTVQSYTGKIIKQARIVNNELIIKDAYGKNDLMMCHQRPILNEILDCEGIAFTCKDVTEEKELKEKLQQMSDKDVLTDTLNEEAFLKRLEQDFNRATRYNENFALIVVELRDLCEFINKGISFEHGDNLLKTIANLCNSKLKNEGVVGRIEKTKIALTMNKVSLKKVVSLARDILESSKPQIKKLGVDDYNAQMLIISYTERKGFTDTFDNMLERTKRRIKNAASHHKYGIISPENDQKKYDIPLQYKE